MDAHKLLKGVESAIYQPGISLTVSVLSWLTLAGVAPRAVLREEYWGEVGFLGSSQKGVLSVEDSEHPMGLSVQESAACSQGREGGV